MSSGPVRIKKTPHDRKKPRIIGHITFRTGGHFSSLLEQLPNLAEMESGHQVSTNSLRGLGIAQNVYVGRQPPLLMVVEIDPWLIRRLSVGSDVGLRSPFKAW